MAKKKNSNYFGNNNQPQKPVFNAGKAEAKKQEPAFDVSDVPILEEDEARAESIRLAKLKQELEEKEKELKLREDALSQRERTLDDGESSLKQQRTDFESSLSIKRIDLDSELKEKRAQAEKEMIERRRILDDELKQKRIDCDAEIARKQTACDDEISQKLHECDEKISEKHSKTDDEILEQRRQNDEYLKKARAQGLEKIAQAEDKHREEFSKNLDAVLKERETQITKRSAELDTEQKQLAEDKAALDSEKEDLARQKKSLSTRRSNLDDEVTEKVNERLEKEREGFKTQLEDLDNRNRKLLEDLSNNKAKIDEVERLRASYGEDPQQLIDRISDREKTIKELNEKIANLPRKELADEYDALKVEMESLEEKYADKVEENSQLRQDNATTADLKAKLENVGREKESLQSQLAILEQDNKRLHDQLARLFEAEGKAAERRERVKALFTREINTYFDNSVEQPTNEIEWLAGISQHCDDYGIKFPKRILYAFHTALKISDWSIITVLAGVSGTGKSELPRLYATFGGLSFISVPVQPNWDSQEAMLGYFNSIDNHFDAQPLLRFLVRCTENFENADSDLLAVKAELDKWISEKEEKNASYPVLSGYMSIALLDEMNLAHVELYFADFLSKLESRRGKAQKLHPEIEVKLGAGIEPYKLKLSRNVLWVGTMNQDETTKSLSDKVLDRGIVINFPRPTELFDRKELKSLDAEQRDAHIPMLKTDTWKNWVKVNDKFLSEEQSKELGKYKGIVEEINNYLAVVGRALGHRVWQSIKYYICNYPDVIAAVNDANGSCSTELKNAMHTAFEDQLVQKIMPKLRGIDTKGRSREECLDKILQLVEDNHFNITEDFKLACEIGYGQFIWSSANYINADEMAHDPKNKK